MARQQQVGRAHRENAEKTPGLCYFGTPALALANQHLTILLELLKHDLRDFQSQDQAGEAI